MLRRWIDTALALSYEPAAFYSGARKILRSRTIVFTRLDRSLELSDVGFTEAKMRQLRKNYVHGESRDIAAHLWRERVNDGSYGSVGFHCFNHYVKGQSTIAFWNIINHRQYGTKKDYKKGVGSVMGPCIQSVSITLLPSGKAVIDLFYRTTEYFKKFPADLVFIRDELLAPFELKDVDHYAFHFANVTCHPMYFITLLSNVDDPIYTLRKLKKRDPYFHTLCVRWLTKYLCDEHTVAISKFSQAMRTRRDAIEKMSENARLAIERYARDNYKPGRQSRKQKEAKDVIE